MWCEHARECCRYSKVVLPSLLRRLSTKGGLRNRKLIIKLFIIASASIVRFHVHPTGKTLCSLQIALPNGEYVKGFFFGLSCVLVVIVAEDDSKRKIVINKKRVSCVEKFFALPTRPHPPFHNFASRLTELFCCWIFFPSRFSNEFNLLVYWRCESGFGSMSGRGDEELKIHKQQ